MKWNCAFVAFVLIAITVNGGAVRAAKPSLDQLLDLNKIEPQGEYYDAVAPDTLDLADRAEDAINVLTRSVKPSKFYAVHGLEFGPEVKIQEDDNWDLPFKHARALPAMRVMCGSRQNLDIELEMMRALMNQISDAGTIPYPADGFHHPKGNSLPWVDGLAVLAMLNWRERDRDPRWLDWIGLICKGLKESVIEVEDRAFYPPESSLQPDGDWHWTLRGDPMYAYHPPDEPRFDQQGAEGSIKFEQAPSYRALAKYYELTGDERAMEVARKIGRFVLKPGMWEDTSEEGYPGHEHGMWAGHFHANVTNLHSLLDLAVADDNAWLKQFVREGYDHAIRNGVVRMGWFPMWTVPEKYKRGKDLHMETEGCGIADMVILAVKLTDAGLGDYWDDVDTMVRNRLAPSQFSDLDLMRGCSREPKAGDEEILSRCVGGFSVSRAGYAHPSVWGCCTPNGCYALYYAWHGITRFDSGVAIVNLFLNRSSAWMDIDSYLPYEGKVVLRNKKARSALARIPSWVAKEQVKCTVDGKEAAPAWTGRYLVLNELDEGAEIVLTFPLETRADEYFIHDKTYTVNFRGSTVIDISPAIAADDGREEWYYPLYHWDDAKADFEAGKAPMKNVKRFAAARVIPLQ